MRNGDLYKMQGMHRIGLSVEEIAKRFRASYTLEEIQPFFPEKPKRGRPKKVADDE